MKIPLNIINRIKKEHTAKIKEIEANKQLNGETNFWEDVPFQNKTFSFNTKKHKNKWKCIAFILKEDLKDTTIAATLLKFQEKKTA